MTGPGDGNQDDLDRTMAWQPPKPPAPGPQGTPASKSPSQPPGLPQVPGITLHAEIARGGMGVVYRGQQDFLDRRVAVKFLSVDLRSDQFAARFRREAKILAGIKHPNIVACHSAGTTDAGQSYLVMEFVDGPNLKSWIGQNGPLGVAAALRMTRALASALGHAHEQGVIHRDVKAENILLESATSTQIDFNFPFVPKLVDLGLARMTHESADMGLTSPGSVMGTPATMSPEQFDDPDGVDFRSDIYGLGCVLYEMLSGRPAFEAVRLSDLVVQKREPVGPNPCDAIDWLPQSVGALVSQLLAADRAQRPNSYEALIEQIDALLLECQDVVRPGPADPMTPTQVSPAKTKPAGSRPPGSGGPGMLKTAEFEFLAAGQAPQATSTPGFRDTVPGAAPTEVTAAPPRGSSVGRMAILAVAVIAGVGVGVWLMNRNSPPSVEPKPDQDQHTAVVPVPAPKPNRPPEAAALGGPDVLLLNKAGTFVASATDPEGDQLTYRWSSPQTRFVAFAPPDAAKTEVRILDGLPTEEFTIEVEISDGNHPPITARKVIKVDEYKPRRLLAGFKEIESPWRCDDPLTWVQNTEDGSVSATAETGARTCSCPLGADAYWQVVGEIEAARFNAPTFAEAGVRLEFGDTGYALLCNRSEPQGTKWSIEIVQEKRVDGAWQRAPLAGDPVRVEWTDDNDEGQLAFFSLKRRVDELTIQVGCREQRLVKSLSAAVPSGATEPVLTLFASGGRGVFREMKVF